MGIEIILEDILYGDEFHRRLAKKLLRKKVETMAAEEYTAVLDLLQQELKWSYCNICQEFHI